MKLFTLFTRQAPNVVFLSMLLSALAGLGNSLLIPILLMSLNQDPDGIRSASAHSRTVLGFEVSHYKFAVAFLTVCGFVLIARSSSRLLLKRAILKATVALRERIYRNIMKVPIADLERLGPADLLSTLTLDVNRVALGARHAPDLTVSAITVLGNVLYLFILNPSVFRYVIGATVVGVIVHQIPAMIGSRYMEIARARFDDLHKSIHGLIYGAKELRLSRTKRDLYFDETLRANESTVLRYEKRAHSVMAVAAACGESLGFFLVGLTAYLFVSYHSIEHAELLAVVMVLLFTTGPVSDILASIPNIAAANVSLKRMERVFGRLSVEELREQIDPIPHWSVLKLANVSYRCKGADGGFQLGPIDLQIRKGEITFIVGGNGSGKSTLCKLIALHYFPDAGEIHMGSMKVDGHSRNSCRQHICAILTDYYLFDRLLMELDNERELSAQQQLLELGLSDTLRIENGRFSRTQLSDGQKKRLALLGALLEDRELYVFDEWAANQDPFFKKLFYLKILPQLRKQNKAVVVISHDDRYFHVADQVIVLEDGKIIHIGRNPVKMQESGDGDPASEPVREARPPLVE